MNNFALLVAAVSAGSLGFSSLVTWLIFRSLKTSPKVVGKTNNKETKSDSKTRGKFFNSVRETNVLTVFPTGIIRTKDGGYIRGYSFQGSDTYYADEAKLSEAYESFARILSSSLPKDACLQFNFDNYNDKGYGLKDKLLFLSGDVHCDETAKLLRQEEIEFYLNLTEQQSFRLADFSLWVYIPSKEKSVDRFEQIKGLISGNRRRSLEITSRSIKEEEVAYTRAKRYFRNLEGQFPLDLKPFSYEEACINLRFSHNPQNQTIPKPPTDIIGDWDSYLLRTPIKHQKGEWFLWHGQQPVTVITLFEPMESNDENPLCHPALMRFLTTNPTLTSRFKVVTEFKTLEKSETITKLKRDLLKIEKTNSDPETGQTKIKNEKIKRQYTEKKQLLLELTSPTKSLTDMRFHIIVYGERVLRVEDKKRAVEKLEKEAQKLLKFINENMNGAEADFEEPEALRDIYTGLLAGEIKSNKTHREIRELADSLSCFIPSEIMWNGNNKNPHNFYVTTTGELCGVNLFQNPHSAAPLTVILGASGSGKSVFGAEIISGVLATIPHAKVVACDYGGSLEPLVKLFNGRYFTFEEEKPQTFNVWDYEGLEYAHPPSSEQIELVIKDTLIMLGVDEKSERGRDFTAVLDKCVRSVYDSQVPLNKKGRKNEPRLSHLILKLRNFHFESTEEKAHANTIAGRLERFSDNPWVDAPTHAEFNRQSSFDVYELKSLEKLPEALRASLAFRIGARVAYSENKVEGELKPTLVVMDEVHEYVSNEYLSYALRGAESVTRHGRKQNKVPILITHSFDDIKHLQGFTSNIGNLFIGRQDSIESLKKHKNWNDVLESAVYNLRNIKGLSHQFFYATGQGGTEKYATLQVYLSPISLWTYTTDPIETNARKVLSEVFPHWSYADVLLWLAKTYPRGLIFTGKERIDEALLENAVEFEMQNNRRYRRLVESTYEDGGTILSISEEELEYNEELEKEKQYQTELEKELQKLDEEKPQEFGQDIQVNEAHDEYGERKLEILRHMKFEEEIEFENLERSEFEKLMKEWTNSEDESADDETDFGQDAGQYMEFEDEDESEISEEARKYFEDEQIKEHFEDLEKKQAQKYFDELEKEKESKSESKIEEQIDYGLNPNQLTDFINT